LFSNRDIKSEIRKRIWDLLEKNNIAKFPRPAYGRIPNFLGAEKAALRLSRLGVFTGAKVVEVSPDSPQKHVRYLALTHGKVVVMPTPRLKKGFIILNPRKIPQQFYGIASTIRGAFTWGVKVSPKNLPEVDLIVTGSVAVNIKGCRLGKGGGYSDLEFAILKELGKVNDETTIATTVHDLQVIEQDIPLDPWDVGVDLIVTPSRLIRTSGSFKPKGILWNYVNTSLINEVPILKELFNMRRGDRHS